MTQPHDWTGRVGDVWAEEWRRTERAFAGLAAHLDVAILAAAPAHAFTGLDIGSGAGSTAIALADARADSTVTGADLSAGLVEVARDRAGDRTNLHFAHADALDEASRRAPLDLLMSRHGVMFFADPHAAFATLCDATAPSGKLVFSCFASIIDNPWATIITQPVVQTAAYAPGPFAFADEHRTRALLRAAGWHDVAARRVDFAYRVGAASDETADPVDNAIAFLRRIGPAASALRDAAPADRAALLDRLRVALAMQRKGDVVDFPAAAWIWTARAGETHA